VCEDGQRVEPGHGARQVSQRSVVTAIHFAVYLHAQGPLTGPFRGLCRAILDLKNQRDKLHQYQRRIVVLTDKETQVAKEMLARGDKKRALLALRRKKYQESLLAKTDGQLAQLESLTSSVEFAQLQKDVLFGLQQGTKVLKEIHAEMGGIDHVEKLMGDTAEEIAYQKVWRSSICALLFHVDSLIMYAMVQEVSEMLSGRISLQDEEEVEDELAALEAEVTGVKILPSAPKTQLQQDEAAESERRPEPERAKEPERQAMLAS
jgi:charged multivesicular body protein 6